MCAWTGKNAFDGYVPSVPEGEKLDYASERCNELETLGELNAAHHYECIRSMSDSRHAVLHACQVYIELSQYARAEIHSLPPQP